MADPAIRRVAFCRSVRGRLLIVALLPMLVLTPILLGITMQRWLMRTDQILTSRVASDLTVGRQYLDHLIDSTRHEVEAFARSADFRDVLPEQTAALLAEKKRMSGLDFLLLGDAGGDPLAETLSMGDAPAVAQGGLVVLGPETLAQLSPDLAARAVVPLITTPGSAPATRAVEDRGLVVLASVPVMRPDGDPGLLTGGILLNHNEGFIDRINDLVYPATNPAFADSVGDDLDLGIITLFLDDTRIATTLRLDSGARAIGTRASAAVATQVLGEGRSWRDMAFVVNDWYFSAYEPLSDIHGNRVGMIYAGIPKAPYTSARQLTFLMIGTAFLLVGGLFVPLALTWVRGVFRPVEAMGRTIRQMDAGDTTARTGDVSGAGEIVQVAEHLDQLLARLAQREGELRGLNDDLNARVEARTADLSRANQALETTSRQLVLSEKLATIGQVTAGVAHEINNPLAVISGNLEVVRLVLAEREAEIDTELQLIDEQVRRINRLVTQLLQFTRPEEFTGGADTDPLAAIEGLRPLVRHMLTRSGVRLEEHLSATGPVRMNMHELQQVLINLITNAVQAMPEGGTITLTLADQPGADGQAGIRITLCDTGRGMDKATLSRIFEPFYTTRGRDGGTGLGLPICLNLITRQGGSLKVDSRPGEGSRFDIWLPGAD